MVRVIAQETYDEVVKENIEEFEMTPDEAIKEAIAQFEAQGVDLTNIIKDLALGDTDSHLVSVAVTKLKDLTEKSEYDDELVLKELDVLKTECKKDLARRMRAAKDGAYNILICLLDKRQKIYLESKSERDAQLIVNVLNTLISLMDTQPDLLEAKGVDLIMSSLDNIEDNQIQIAILKWAAVCCLKHEMNRRVLFSKDIVKSLKSIITAKNAKVVSAALPLVRRLTLDDDVREEFGKAHEHAREMGAHLLDPLTRALQDNMKPSDLSDIMSTITALLVTSSLCQAVADGGAGRRLFTILADNVENAAVVLPAIRLITALAGNDDVKRSLVESGIILIMITLLVKYEMDPVVAPALLKCVAMICLRESPHGRQFLENGAPEAIVSCIKNHPENEAVQKNACWAIRNMVARCRDFNGKFHELGAEELLNAALSRFGASCGFDIKSALRDLECDVTLHEQWTGRGKEIDN